MQSWSNSGQDGADGHNSWQSAYAFDGQDAHFDPNQSWPQSMVDQAGPYSHIETQEGAAPNYFDPSQSDNAFLAGNLHGTTQPQPSYNSQDSLSLAQQYSQSAQDVVDAPFHNIHPDIYAQSGKMDIGDGMGHLGQVQGHPHAHPQSFAEYSFAQNGEQAFESPVPQYSQAQLLAQQARQQSHTPVQRYEALHGNFPHGQTHGYSRPPQPSPVQRQQAYSHNSPSFQGQMNPQTGQYDASTHVAYQQQVQRHQSSPPPQQPQQPSQGYQQPNGNYIPQRAPVYQQQPIQHSPRVPESTTQAQYAPQHQQQAPHLQPQPQLQQSPPQPPPQSQTPEVIPGSLEQVAAEPAPKKRKRTSAKTSPEIPFAEPVVFQTDSPAEVSLKKPGETIDSFDPPVPSPEDAQALAQFSKRPKAAQTRFPSIKGLPYLMCDGTVKLPVPKSYDKLAPVIALPSRSTKPMVPELGYPLPCELQGRFTSQYRPSLDKKGGLDERRAESQGLLDEFDHSMHALGKRRPKYTEYPHAFKEQLKSDEASKKKAKKELEGDKDSREDRNKPIRSATRPTDPVEAAGWDVIGIVHIDEATARTNSLIAGRVQQAGDFFIKLRSDMNKSKLDLDQAIKEKRAEAEIAALRHDADQKREALYKALDATLIHADDAVLDNLGGHQKLVLSLVNVLISCIKATDFSGKLPAAVWELFTHFRMTKKIAETTNFETVRKKFADKGDKKMKELVQEVTVNIKKLSKTEESSTGYTGTSNRPKVAKPADTTSVKRNRDDEADTRTVKKIAVEPGTSLLSKKLAQPKIQPPMSRTGAAKTGLSSVLPGKMKPVAKPTPRPEQPAGDDSASGPSDDKGSKVEVKKTVSKFEPKGPRTETPVPLPKVPTSSTSSALSGIASLLDSINAPKADSPGATPKEAKGADVVETAEEKAKRLKKEARRKLRVSWKPENELVQVKIFHKDDGEDDGREGNMIRDAADDRSEGMVLKQRAADVDEDDEDDDIPYQPWVGPVATNFSVLPEEVRHKNYVTRGGNVTFATEEQQLIAEREQKELMALYTDIDDIPATPKSPPPDLSAIDSERKTVQLPSEDAKFQEIHLRWRDEQQMGIDGALYAATKRLDAKGAPSSQLDTIFGRLREAPTGIPHTAQSSTSGSSIRLGPSNVKIPLLVGAAAEGQALAILESEKIKTWHDRSPIIPDPTRVHNYADEKTQMAAMVVELTSKVLSGKPYPATAPPEWLLDDDERVREWWLGYNKEAAAKQKKMEEERAKAEAEASAAATAAAIAAASAGNAQQDWSAYYAQQQAYAPYMALLQQMNGGQQNAQAGGANAQAIPDNQLQSILAAINQPSQPQAQAQAQQPLSAASFLNPNDPSYQQVMMLAQMSQGQGQGQMSGTNGNHDGERDWDRNDNYQSGSYKDNKGKKKATLPPHKPANRALIGTKPCTFWQQGKCARGDKCTFRHD